MNDIYGTMYRDICVFCWKSVKPCPWFSVQHQFERRFIYFCDSNCMKAWRKEREIKEKAIALRLQQPHTKLLRIFTRQPFAR